MPKGANVIRKQNRDIKPNVFFRKMKRKSFIVVDLINDNANFILVINSSAWLVSC